MSLYRFDTLTLTLSQQLGMVAWRQLEDSETWRMEQGMVLRDPQALEHGGASPRPEGRRGSLWRSWGPSSTCLDWRV